MFQASLRSDIAPPPSAFSPVVDILEDGLTITTRLDPASVEEFIGTVSEGTLLLLVVSEPGTSTYLLIVAHRDQLATLWTEELHGILLCAANRNWMFRRIRRRFREVPNAVTQFSGRLPARRSAAVACPRRPPSASCPRS